MRKKQNNTHKNSMNSRDVEAEESSTRPEKNASAHYSPIESALLEQLLWWQLKVPIEVVEMLSVAPRVVRSEDSSSNHQLLKWLTNPQNSQKVELSSAWKQWFDQPPKSFFDRIDGKQLVALSAKVESVLMTPQEVIGLTQEIKTDFGKRKFYTQLHCLIEPDEIRVWANLVDANSFLPSTSDLNKDNNSLEFFYERQVLMEEQNKVIKSSFQKQSRFLAMLSHELRSPLLGLQAMAKRLAQKYHQEEELNNSFESMSSTVEYLSYLINDILTYSQTEFNSVQLYPHEFDLESLLKDVEMLTKDIAKQKKLDVTVVYKGEKQTLFGDRVRLKQVFLNLIVNAIKFTETGGVILEAEKIRRHEFLFKVKDSGEGIAEDRLNRIFEPFMQLESSRANNQFGAVLGLFVVKQLIELMGGTIEVTSQPGVGTEFSFRLNLSEHAFQSQQLLGANRSKRQNAPSVSVNNKEKLAFQKSNQIDSKTRPDNEKDILDFFEDHKMVPFDETTSQVPKETRHEVSQTLSNELLDGDSNPSELDELDALMETYSSIDEPSQFSKPSEILPDEIIHTKSNNTTSYRPINVLIADDSDLNLWVLADLLKEFDCVVTETADGAEAWEAFQKEKFDLVILDIQMPFMSGIEVAQNIRASGEQSEKLPPIVAVTAGGDEFVFQNEQRSLEGVFDDWILKPIDLALIKKILERHLLLVPESIDESHDEPLIQPSDSAEKIAGHVEKDACENDLSNINDSYDEIPKHLIALFDDFVAQTTELLALIESSVDAKNWEDAAGHAHKLKGNMMLFQLNDAVVALKNLELTVKSGENPDLKQENCHQICQTLRTLLKALEKSHSIKDN
ncbi:ATP-binding protein [Thiomicrorhabdus indica]|uniref:ATP-binding protein n=1 Tax=Thiomicrorhabdus indica TaxID=2267253 RepID=UPI0013EEB490|nr:ATP-binding protein [Thiomicrorhabdus indica]